MFCIYCGHKTRVVNSRNQKKTNNTWRRRRCSDCQAVVTTLEQIDLGTAVTVIGNKGSKDSSFIREKLLLSIYKSLEHRKNPIEDATGITNTIISQLLPKVASGTLTASQIAQTTTKVLSNFDKAAATHYQAFHPQLKTTK